MGKYICCVCNNEFEAKHKTAICLECKSTPSVCVICGKEFPKSSPYNQKTCSAVCRGKYRAQTGVAKQGAAKMKQTKLDRYGTLDPSIVAISRNGDFPKRICPLCKKEFQPRTVRQVYCEDKHYAPCPVCGKITEIKDYNIGVQACSDSCRVARIQSTCLEKYGDINVLNSKHGKELAKQTNLEKYGSEYYSQTEECKQRYKKTIKEKYGVNAPIQFPEFKEKSKQTNLKRYGVEWAMQCKEIKEKVRKCNVTRYGGLGIQSPLLRQKIISTNRIKYGSDFGFGNASIQEKSKNSIRRKYHVDNFKQSLESLSEVIIDPSKAHLYFEFRENPQKYVSSHYNYKPSVKTLCSDLGVSDTPVYDVLIKKNCKDIVDRTKTSYMESEMYQFLITLVDKSDIIVNDRIQIKPQELDFYLPKYNFAIECNPTSTHNSSIASWEDTDVKTYNYHQKKSLLAQNKGIFLMHVFGYEWIHKKEILKSMIRNILGKNHKKIYARQTKVVQLDDRSCKEFLDANHRQGNCSSRIRLGLVTKSNDELVSVMTFSNTRTSIGKQSSDTTDTYELIRFCSKLDTNVVGGASKLFKYFIDEYNPDKIISFSDIAHTKGNLYLNLGFVEKGKSEPGYVWAKFLDQSYRSRVSCQKKNLIKVFDDVTEETIRTKSEGTIMQEHGYVKVYDSGVIRWEWTPENNS